MIGHKFMIVFLSLPKTVLFGLMFYCAAMMADEGGQCGNKCTFVLKSETSGRYQVTNVIRSKQRFSPFSTFKIANSVIALDLGLVLSLAQELSFDQTVYPVQQWWPKVWYQAPLNLKQAFQNSAVPIYQQLASQVGEKKMGQLVAEYGFGNADISSGVDNFWLNGSLQITAREQVDFLQRLNERKLPVSGNAIAQLRDMMLVETTDTYRLFAKTGGGQIAKGSALGWYVGFVENETGTHYFALNLEANTFNELRESRITIARQQLKLAGII